MWRHLMIFREAPRIAISLLNSIDSPANLRMLSKNRLPPQLRKLLHMHLDQRLQRSPRLDKQLQRSLKLRLESLLK